MYEMNSQIIGFDTHYGYHRMMSLAGINNLHKRHSNSFIEMIKVLKNEQPILNTTICKGVL